MRVIVAMSGGVDSSVAAALLAEQGHDVIGLSMQLYDQREGEDRFGSCCTIEDLRDARLAAAAIGVRHYIVNFEREFETHVISNFVREYSIGRTPIPCVHCNADLKFSHLLDRAKGLDADFVATGHYARVEWAPSRNRYLLKRGIDPNKDQSYFLFSLDQSQLAHAIFPIGHLPKEKVRGHARSLGLSVADKPDSHELCFVAQKNRTEFIERRAPQMAQSGTINDRSGRVLGHHDGVHQFTIGQRKGLGLSSTMPLYVLEINATSNQVTIGPRQDLERTTLIASDVNWIAYEPPTNPVKVTAQIRYRHQEAHANIQALPNQRAMILFDEPQVAIAPGQAVVFYDGEDVVGGGWIEKSDQPFSKD